MNRFVILEHDYPELHWDFMLELDGVLKTWRLSTNPLLSPQDQAVEMIADHRIFYLDYEGEVSGNRGTVKRIDEGTYRQLEKNPVLWRIVLEGQTIQGTLTLTSGEHEFWNFEFEAK